MPKAFLPLTELLSERQLSLSFTTSSLGSSVAVTPEIYEMLTSGTAVAIGVSGERTVGHVPSGRQSISTSAK
jgi:hypothetical protein